MLKCLCMLVNYSQWNNTCSYLTSNETALNSKVLLTSNYNTRIFKSFFKFAVFIYFFIIISYAFVLATTKATIICYFFYPALLGNPRIGLQVELSHNKSRAENKHEEFNWSKRLRHVRKETGLMTKTMVQWKLVYCSIVTWNAKITYNIAKFMSFTQHH